MRVTGPVQRSLVDEHPVLGPLATRVIEAVRTRPGSLDSVDKASVWGHHMQYAERAVSLSEHLDSAMSLANEARYPSAFVLLRTALEQMCIDRLLLLATRYRERFPIVTDEQYDALVADLDARVEPWTQSVVSIEREQKSALLVRVGHPVVDDAQNVVERLSPYHLVVENHNALLGPPSAQDERTDSFRSLEELRQYAARNRGMYDSYLRWSAIVDNLNLNDLLTESEGRHLEAHYRFLSAFTHATGTGYDQIDRLRGGFGRRQHDHYLGELALLYVIAVGTGLLSAYVDFVAQRDKLLLADQEPVEALCDVARHLIGYFWFPGLDSGPVEYDQFKEANHRAWANRENDPQFKNAVPPHQIPPDEVGYYRNPLGRLQKLHEPHQEMTTGFYYRAPW